MSRSFKKPVYKKYYWPRVRRLHKTQIKSGEAPIKSIFNSYKSGAKSRNLIFELTVKDVKTLF